MWIGSHPIIFTNNTNAQITVLSTEPLLPGLMDANGSVPLRSLLSFSNPNIFRIYCSPSGVTIYTDPEYTHELAQASVPALALHAHERERTVATDYAIEDIMHVQGGPVLIKRVLQGRHTFFYATSRIGLRVKGLGFVPVTRHYELRCKVIKLWPKPGGNSTSGGELNDESPSVADCHGRFV